MNLHSNRQLLGDAIQATAQLFGIRDIYVEKDYWITVALFEIFHSNMADQAVFKGGTALSKCYGLIERFSEDIDIVVLRNAGENDNQLKRKIREIGKVVGRVMPEVEVAGLTHKRGTIRKTVHSYDKLYDGDFGQVREHIVLEATWLGNFEPYSIMKISSYVAQMMGQKGQQELIQYYTLTPFFIRVLGKERTFCEKVMSLVRFSRAKDPIGELRNKIRHVYDIHQMLKDPEVQSFFDDHAFDRMLLNVGHEDMVSYKNNNNWIPEHPATALLFAQPDKTWEKLSSEYSTSFKDLVTGDFPSEDHLIETLKKVAQRLSKVAWEIG